MTDLTNEWMTEMFVEKPLALPWSAKNIVTWCLTAQMKLVNALLQCQEIILDVELTIFFQKKTKQKGPVKKLDYVHIKMID